ncbi:PREDICTED: vacuolar amino acid transporter 4-like, partial [Rhagoletis zephyria]|uniref:vacuolar amino acid transporter 4-like n=2 Tax=Rhagoletis zephyria TaxID=28612 RepID=UPI0008116DF7
VMEHWLGYEISLRLLISALLIPLILLSWIPNLKYLAPVSMVANLFMGLGLGITFYYLVSDLPPITTREFAKVSTLPAFFAITIFAMEAIGVVMPLENNMEKPRHFLGICGVLSQGMSGVTLIYMALGFLGYLRYGTSTEESITLNLPVHEWTKSKSLYELSSHLDYDVFVLVETWLTPDFYDNEFFDPNLYNVYRKDRDSLKTGLSRGGGLLIAVHRKYRSSILLLHDGDSLLDQLSVSVTGAFDCRTMAHRKIFKGQKDFLPLQEAVDWIMENEDNDSEYDILVIPPDPAIVSDEEEVNEDDLVVSRRQDDTDWDERGDEPLSCFAKRKRVDQ